MAEQQDGDGREPQPIDEEAAWAAIVAGYGEEPADPPGAKPFRPVENLSLPEPEDGEDGAAGEVRPVKGTAWKPRPKPLPDPAEETGPAEDPEAGPERPAPGSSIVFAPGVRAGGPRDHSPAEPDDAAGGADEGHFVPPEPPPLPEADTTTKFAWLAVVGGPVLMLLAVLLQWDMTWWLTTLCVGGFLGGFATLVARMKHDDEDDDGFDDPGRGAVV
ncbi:hypothetical protein GCM10010275_28190 [Streptomyces litmocidini]|uniref:hypothetical protein n=1 Tax=Streptomyces litmocidini TaxID=67318 RepID=UPI00167D104D|nr:hypothetical protein [Streptomyces litmocidini]GGU89873.1 hypothetical protein GCM10010275_28190 [Streptomyces litmocidini]